MNVALPSIQHSLGATEAQLQWVLSGYALSFGLVLVPAGRAGDVYGRGGVFITGLAVFVVASIVAGCSRNALSLDIARLIQGGGAGLFGPQAIGMVQEHFRGVERARAFGMFGTTVGLSVAAGNVLGGFLLQVAGVGNGWRWTFLVNVPVGIGAISLAYAWLPRPLFASSERGNCGLSVRQRLAREFDVVGGLLLASAVVSVLLPFMYRTSSGWVWMGIPISGLLVYVWMKWERDWKSRGRKPMVDLDLLRIRSFSLGTFVASAYFLGATSTYVLVALYMQEGLGRSAMESGMVAIPGALMTMLTARWGSRSLWRYGRGVVVVGIATALTGLALSVIVVQLHGRGLIPVWWLLVTFGVLGAGQGAVVSPNQALTLEHVPLSYAGTSGALMQTAQRIAASVGVTFITTIAFIGLEGKNWMRAATWGFLSIGAFFALALLVAVSDWKWRRGQIIEKVQ